MVQPRTVIERIHAAPAVQKNDDWRGTRLRRVRLKDPVFVTALAVFVLYDRRVRVLLAARPCQRLRRRCGTLRSKIRKEEKCQSDTNYDRNNNPPQHFSSLCRAERLTPARLLPPDIQHHRPGSYRRSPDCDWPKALPGLSVTPPASAHR